MNTYLVRINVADQYKIEVKASAPTSWEALHRVARRVPYGMGALLDMVARNHARTLSRYDGWGWVAIDVVSYRPDAWKTNAWHAAGQSTIRDMDGAEISLLMRACLDMPPLESRKVCLDGVVWEVVG